MSSLSRRMLNIFFMKIGCYLVFVSEILGQASEELQNDKAFIMEAIEWNYKCYYYLKERMRKDRDIALLVVSKEGYMLEDSDIKHCFSADKEVVKAAVMSSHSAIMFASSKLKEDREFFKNDILPFDPSLFRYAHLQLRSDITYISELIVNFPQCIQYAISNIQGDIEYVLELIKINPLVVLYANWKELSTEYAIKKITQHDLPDSVISSIYEELDDDYALDSFRIEGYCLQLVDTPYSYDTPSKCHIFIMCYSISNPVMMNKCLKDFSDRFLPEIQPFLDYNRSVLVVGTKSDICDYSKPGDFHLGKYWNSYLCKKYDSYGKKLSQRMGAVSYVTTSSREFVGLEELEDLIVKTFIYSKLIKAPVLNKKEKCLLC
ncbi:predicted protein [Naegleria gruberi]|uniref:Predicted protein n=1 Tax=Naegleria gruberi TaxID=5762 RepID=D2W4J1_NAEGR|nr:uncharacterized protein NAEGRDRAFT_76325 [Naegleria gruberi]EFC36011.1 predicted protein [Naegleria gruberi]|eukprot:XP_002668755.1 predicted protein [Naegleria gruberi strain NEG-M]